MNHSWDKKIASNQANPTGDLIPSTSWGSSLSNMLLSSQWEAQRLAAKARAGHKCELCGIDEERSKHSLEAHEMWSYTPLGDVGGWGIQKLENVISVCKDCHICFHLGFAQVKGWEKRVFKRVQDLNQWDKTAFDRYLNLIFKRWHQHNQYLWALDLSWMEHNQDGELKFKTGVQRVTPGGQVLDVFGKGQTIVLNMPYRLMGDLEVSVSLLR